MRCAIYRVPRSRAFIPGLKSFMLGCCRDLAHPYDDVPEGRVGDDKTSWRGRFGWQPPFEKVGNHYCGAPRQWLEGSVASDPLLEWTPFGFSLCCEGVLPVGTENTLAMFGPGPLALLDSPISYDPVGLALQSSAPLCLPWLCLPLFDQTDTPPAGHGAFFVDATGKVWLRYEDDSLAQLLRKADGDALYLATPSPPLADGVVPVWDTTTGKFVASRITDSGASYVETAGALRARDEFALFNVANAATLTRLISTHVAGVSLAQLFVDRLGLGVKGATLTLSREDSAVKLDVADAFGALRPRIGLNGSYAADISTNGWDVRSGLVYAVPSLANWQAFLTLGSMAQEDAADYYLASEVDTILLDYAETAALGSMAYEDAADYYLASEVDTLLGGYAPIGGTKLFCHLASTTAAIATATWTTVPYDTETTDSGGEFDTSTSTFTPATTGTYVLTAFATLGGATTRNLLSVWVGTASEHAKIADGTLIMPGGTIQVDLNAGVGYRVRVMAITGTPTINGGVGNTYLRIRRQWG